jgi:hypothetical protein
VVPEEVVGLLWRSGSDVGEVVLVVVVGELTLVTVLVTVLVNFVVVSVIGWVVVFTVVVGDVVVVPDGSEGVDVAVEVSVPETLSTVFVTGVSVDPASSVVVEETGSVVSVEVDGTSNPDALP